MQTLLPESRLANTIKVEVNKAANIIPSIGLAIPFQPSMQDEKYIQMQLRTATAMLEAKMNNSFDKGCINVVLVRLQKLFSTLNYNSHCKSISLILTADEQKVVYLNFPVKPVTCINEHISLLHLISTEERQPEFYFLFLRENNATLYEYHHNNLNRVYLKNQSHRLVGKAGDADMFKQVSQTINLLNTKNGKPVFVAGSPNVVERFCNTPYYSNIFFTLLYEVAPFCGKIRASLVKEICSHWKYWQSKFLAGKITIAQKSNHLTSNVEGVLKALSQSADGWLLLDRNLKRQLLKSLSVNALINKSDELMGQLERFLERGNCIEITEPGLLEKFGGIVLLRNTPSSFYERKFIHLPGWISSTES